MDALLTAARQRRLTALVAGAGFGKTTALSQTFGDGRTAWHTMTAVDRSVSSLARSVIEKLRLAVPGLSADVMMAVAGGRGPDSGGDHNGPEALAAALAQDLAAHLTRDLVFVVDGVHELTDAPASARFLGALCRQAPPSLHLVVASRSALPFPIARMRLGGDAEEIGAQALAFTVDEVDALARARLDGTAHPGLVREVMERTAGWPVAVVYAIEATRQTGTVDLDTALRGESLMSYLAEEVLHSSPPELIAALATAAVLPWVDADLLTQVIRDPRPAGVLHEPLPHLFITVPEFPRAQKVAPFVHEYVSVRLRLPEAERRSVLEAAAEWYEAGGFLSEALSCRRAVDDSPALARFLAEKGADLISLGLAREYVSALDQLETRLDPGHALDDEVVLQGAEATQILGDWERAMSMYRRLIGTDGEIPARIAWRLGFLHHMRGDVVSALETYELGSLDGAAPFDGAALHAWKASAHFLRGERDEAHALARRALELAQEAGAEQSLATAHTVLAMVAALDGDRAANDTHYLRALEHAERAGDVVQTIRIRSNRGSHFLEEGDFDSALAELEIALRLADMSGFELWRGMSLSNRGQILLMRGALEESVADLTQAREIFRRIGSNFESYPLSHLGDVYDLRGDTAMARASYEESIAMADRQGDLQGLVPALSGLAKLLLDEDLPQARDLVKRAVEVDSVIGRVRALVTSGWVELASGETDAAAALAAEAAEAAGARRDFPGLAEALELQAACAPEETRLERLSRARAVWEDVGMPVGVARVDLGIAELTSGTDGMAIARRASHTLSRLGAKGLAMAGAAVAERLGAPVAGAVRIQTLGGFRVSIDGEPVPVSAWQSKVARNLLGMLAAARGRRINREVLLERLWPGEDPAKANNRLSVALSTIRSVLDPDKEHDPGWYILADRQTVALSTERVEVDVVVFLERAVQGKQMVSAGQRDHGLAILESAEAAYLGDFLEEHPYDEWTIGTREEARTAYVNATTLLAEADAAAREFDSAGRRYLRILERDPYNEPAHLALVQAMVLAGRHGAARRLYGTYVSRMREIGVEPGAFPD